MREVKISLEQFDEIEKDVGDIKYITITELENGSIRTIYDSDHNTRRIIDVNGFEET